MSALMSPQALCAYLNGKQEDGPDLGKAGGEITVNTLYQWNHKGYGPKAIRVGRHLRYRRADVEAWLSAQAVA